MNSKISSFLSLSVEDHELVVYDISEDEKNIADEPAPVAIVELIDGGNEILEIDQNGAVLVDIASELEAIVEEAQEIKEEGFITVESLGLLTNNAAKALSRAGQPLTVTSFEDCGSTRVAMESLAKNVKEHLRRFWQGIVNAVRAVYSRIKGFFTVLSDVNNRMRIRASVLANRSVELSKHFANGRKAKKDTITVSAKYLSYKGKVDGHDVEVGIRETIKDVRRALPHIEEAAKDLSKRIDRAARAVHQGESNVSVDNPAFASGIKYGELLGGYQLALEASANHVYFTVKPGQRKHDDVAEIATPLPNVLHSIATEIVHLTHCVDEVRHMNEKIGDLVLGQIQLLEKASQGNDDKAVNFSVIQHLARVGRQNFSVDLVAITNYLHLVGGAASVLCTRAIHAY